MDQFGKSDRSHIWGDYLPMADADCGSDQKIASWPIVDE